MNPTPEKRSHSRYERLPIVCIVFYGLALISIGLYIAICNSVTFADGFNSTVSAAIRCVLSYLTAWIPFSVGEMLIILLPLILFFTLRHAIRHHCKNWRTAAVYVGTLLSVVALLFSTFVLTFAAGYRARPISEKLGLKQETVTTTDLYRTALILVASINGEVENISFSHSGFSTMPYTLSDMNHELADAYDTFSDTHDFLHHTAAKIKPVLLSRVMSRMHITGVYSFFTGEANLNVNFPDYTLPSTAAHELAHQRGIAREDEASFLSFLVCTGSDDPYIRYSGYMMAYEYVASELRRTDVSLYKKVASLLNTDVKGELTAYAAFFEPYENSVIGDISSSVNNSYLQSQGTAGVKSYSMVADLIVAYYRA